jgi:hypothetical protein
MDNRLSIAGRKHSMPLPPSAATYQADIQSESWRRWRCWPWAASTPRPHFCDDLAKWANRRYSRNWIAQDLSAQIEQGD